jgi:purine-binding chemotaxis protein CheW
VTRRPSGKKSRQDAGAPGAPRLPEAGLSEEILALWDEGTAAAPAELATGPERLYALADRLAARRPEQREAPPELPETWVAVEVAGEVYALPVAGVEEVLRVNGITRLPYAPAPVRGITQQRGRVLTVVDLRVRLGYEPAPLDERSRICVVSSRGRSLGLLVDAARHVVKLLPSGKQPPPADVMSERSAFILGVYRLEDALAILLDVDRVLLLDDSPREPAGAAAAP